jgi:hypothetical protein
MPKRVRISQQKDLARHYSSAEAKKTYRLRPQIYRIDTNKQKFDGWGKL